MRRATIWLLLGVTTACARPQRAALTPAPSPSARLAAADRLLSDGCLECFVAAYRAYDALRSEPSASAQATAGTIRAAALIAVRERELGMADEGYLKVARDLSARASQLAAWVRAILDVVEVLPGSLGAGRPPASDQDLEKAVVLRKNRESWTPMLRSFAELDELAAYTWLSLMCGAIDARDVSIADIFAAASTFRETPLGTFKRATCRGLDPSSLEALAQNDPRFIETTYLLGLIALGQRRLDDAEQLFQRAYDWHPRWSSLTHSMANVAMAAEEFGRAVLLYDETLAVEPRALDALLGKVRALTYEGRHEAAIETTDQLLAERWYLGEARYWRALNEADLERYDEAWADIEASAKLLINAEVPKLAGIIAYRLGQIDLARTKLEESRTRNPNDCETAFYLGTVLGEQRAWDRSAAVLVETLVCLDRAEQALEEEIATIRASHVSPERQARQIARREQQLANGRRTRITSWFDLAVAYYSLSRTSEARRYAEKLVGDEQFGERAREILARLR